MIEFSELNSSSLSTFLQQSTKNIMLKFWRAHQKSISILQQKKEGRKLHVMWYDTYIGKKSFLVTVTKIEFYAMSVCRVCTTTYNVCTHTSIQRKVEQKFFPFSLKIGRFVQREEAAKLKGVRRRKKKDNCFFPTTKKTWN